MIHNRRHLHRLVVLGVHAVIGVFFWLMLGEHSQEWTAGAFSFYFGLYVIEWLDPKIGAFFTGN